MSSVSSAMRRREACGTNSSVRMLCRRSASLTSSTRTSSAIASSSLRRFSACLALARDQLQPFQLGEPFDQRADLVAEHIVDLGARRLGILDGVVQQGSDDGGVIELEVGQDRRDFERMGKIGIAGRARLRAVRLHGVDIGAIEQVFVGIGIIRPDAFDQVVLPHHARARRFAAFPPQATSARPRPGWSRPAFAGGCGANTPSHHCLFPPDPEGSRRLRI